MPEYELRLRFTAADSNQAERLAADDRQHHPSATRSYGASDE